ncbi:hypothetical protein BV22DRAFT_1127365 [Leucogyrophana mollusca]|uniref:Uncharacterized protein n=1 Tax=Leucogyrophana mollusca TaxID=85980 RepID=A0ACB8BQ07_9AGAM|nr:hypothetical protein BV22DRAFT_1127365 [Leucogyrophana mollusca]
MDTLSYTDLLDEPGPFVIGYALSFTLMGFLTLQTLIYFTRSSNDPAWMKIFVWTIFLAELLISIFAFHGFWVGATQDTWLSAIFSIEETDTAHPSLYPDLKVIWCFQALACLTGFVSCLTHGFFCWRIWALRRSLLFPTSVMIVSLLQFAMVAYGGITDGLIPTPVHPAGTSVRLQFYIPIWLCGSLLCDMAITIYMTLVLRQERISSPFRITRSLSVKLIKLIVETGLVTTVAALIELILAIHYSSTLYHLAIFYTISKLYANCVLANLNARHGLRNLATESTAAQRHSNGLGLHPVGGPSDRFSTIQIFKRIETDIETDSSHVWSSR